MSGHVLCPDCLNATGPLSAGLRELGSDLALNLLIFYPLLTLHRPQNLAYLTYSMSTILFGVLIAQTYSPIPALVKWFPFVMPFTGRGCFMIYVGLGLFYGEFDFIDLVGLFTIIFGIVFLALSCTGKVKDPEEQGGVKATGTANRV